MTQNPFAADVEFIVRECGEMAKMKSSDILRSWTETGLSDLPHPSGVGRMSASRAAVLRVANLADEAGRRWGLIGRVTHRTLFSAAEDLFVQRFITEARPIDRKQVDRFMAAVGREASKACSDVTHFIPCSLMISKKPEHFRLGPVDFYSKGAFASILRAKLKGHGNDMEDGWRRENSRSLMAEAVRFFRKFGWVAEVRVERCDPDTAEKIAERAVTSALDCLQILFTARHTEDMRVGGPALSVDNRAKLTVDSSGNLLSSVSTSWAGQVGFPENWTEELGADHDTTELVRLFGIVLQVAVDPDMDRPISRRFLDAAQWFGEACRDNQPATRVVKFVTALERLLMTDEKDDIAKLVSERVAAICTSSDGSSRQEWIRDTKDIYDLRSRLVHGSMSPSDPEIGRGVWLAARISESALLNVLPTFGEQSLSEKISTKRLGKWFDQVVQIVQQRQAAS